MIKESFNQGWSFSKSDRYPLNENEPDRYASETALPHDASIMTPRNPDEPNGSGNGFFQEVSCAYSKVFTLNTADSDKIIILEFEGVYQNAFVYVNNSFAGKHPYGYGNFYIDITKYIRPGENTIKVLVKNTAASGRWYTGSGIYRNVSIMKSDRLHIVPGGVRLSTVGLEEDLAVERCETEIEYRGLGTKSFMLQTSLYDGEGKLAAQEETAATLSEGEKGTYRQRLDIPMPEAWDSEHPYLYTYHVKILDQNRVVDEESGTCGIRFLQLDGKRGLRVNGKTVKLRGGCLHHDNGIIGAMDFPHAAQEKIRKLKEAGFNAIRSSHYPISRNLLDACDRMGMYVMDEFSDVWTSCKADYDYGMHMSEWWEYDLTNMVYKDFNHPCVIMYSIGNEIPETGDRFDRQYGKKLADLIRSIDHTRYTVECMSPLLSMMNDLPTALAEMGADGEIEAGEINELMTNMGDALPRFMTCAFAGRLTNEASGQVDITGLNYAAGRYMEDVRLHPNRIFVGSETYPPEIDLNWSLVEELPYVIGDFAWTAWDYLGETGIGKPRYNRKAGISFYTPYPDKAAYCGDFNLIGDARPAAYWKKSIWGFLKHPYIAVRPPEHYHDQLFKTGWILTDAVRSWNHHGFEGKPVNIEVYTDAEEIELKINGVCAGRKRVGEEKKNIVFFDTLYTPGTLEAIAYKGGKETGRDTLRTASDSVRMDVSSDRQVIPADGSDICYVDLSLKDENGCLNPEAVRRITAHVEGAGYLLGFGSAAPSSEENYYDNSVNTYEGRLRAAIRADQTGLIQVTFSSEGMDSVTVQVIAE